MNRAQADALFASWIAPLSSDSFFVDICDRRLHVDTGSEISARQDLLGSDPRERILGGFATHSSQLGAHAAQPTGPPPAKTQVNSADAFAALVAEYHRRGYTVRIPHAEAFSSDLRQFLQALALIFGKAAQAEIFWSAKGLTAPVHYDDYDLIAVHLHGEKRWFIADEEPRLSNSWKRIGEPPPVIEKHGVYDLQPGDLIYCPRGTAHTVESPTESLHLSIGFAPLTVRDAVHAALDYLSDLDRPLRMGLGDRADAASRSEPLDRIMAQLQTAIARLEAACEKQDFVSEALDQRASQMVAGLSALTPNDADGITELSELRHAPDAIAHVRETLGVVDFAQPGGHIPVHAGAGDAVRFIAETPSFRVADIPGEIGDDVRVALATRFVQSGFLEISR